MTAAILWLILSGIALGTVIALTNAATTHRTRTCPCEQTGHPWQSYGTYRICLTCGTRQNQDPELEVKA